MSSAVEGAGRGGGGRGGAARRCWVHRAEASAARGDEAARLYILMVGKAWMWCFWQSACESADVQSTLPMRTCVAYGLSCSSAYLLGAQFRR